MEQIQHTDAETGYHFNVMRRAIDLIDGADGPLSLDALAAEMGMSPAHFQRIFSRWVGCRPSGSSNIWHWAMPRRC